MKHWMVSYPGATWGDVFVDSNGRIGCAYDHGTLGDISYYSIIDGNLVLVMSTSFVFDEIPLFIRADKNQFGQIAVLAKGQLTGKFMAKGSISIPNVDAYGTHSCDLIPTEFGFRFVVQTGKGTYYDSMHGDLLVPEIIYGTSQGFIQLTNDGPVWADLARQTVPEMLYPYYAGDVIVGEGAVDPPHLQALEGNSQHNIYDGYAARPRACFDAQSNLFAVAARSENGVNFHFYRLPFEENPVACTPVPPTQDIIRDCLSGTDKIPGLRPFMQTYVVPDTGNDPNWHGKKPYVNDEIHTGGLYMADGILYFMMSDTGNWAKALMNPDDKRPQTEKAITANNNLIKYMKERVGDFS